MTWRIDAEGAPPQTRPSEAAALELQAELMAKGARYCVVWWEAPPGLRKAPRRTPGRAQDARGGRSGTPGLLGPFQALTAADTRGDG